MYIPQVMIEGGDLTGKTTFREQLFKSKDTSIARLFYVGDRSILTHYLYNKHFNRFPHLHDSNLKDLIDYLSGAGLIILTLSDESIKERFNKRGDDLYNLDSVLSMNEEYNKMSETLDALPFVKTIKADNKDVNRTIVEALQFCEKMVNTSIESRIWNLSRLIDVFGRDVGRTKELNNIRLQTVSQNLTASDDYYILMNYFKDSIKDVEHKEYDLAIEDYKKFYDSVLTNMIYVIDKEMKMNGQKLLSSRRFHFTNERGACINTIGLNFRETDNVYDCYLTINFRSSDIAILPFDVRGSFDVVDSLFKSDVFGFDIGKKINNFYTTINLESVHISLF